MTTLLYALLVLSTDRYIQVRTNKHDAFFGFHRIHTSAKSADHKNTPNATHKYNNIFIILF